MAGHICPFQPRRGKLQTSDAKGMMHQDSTWLDKRHAVQSFHGQTVGGDGGKLKRLHTNKKKRVRSVIALTFGTNIKCSHFLTPFCRSPKDVLSGTLFSNPSRMAGHICPFQPGRGRLQTSDAKGMHQDSTWLDKRHALVFIGFLEKPLNTDYLEFLRV